jgi:hypothetical protein
MSVAFMVRLVGRANDAIILGGGPEEESPFAPRKAALSAGTLIPPRL